LYVVCTPPSFDAKNYIPYTISTVVIVIVIVIITLIVILIVIVIVIVIIVIVISFVQILINSKSYIVFI